MQAFPHQDRSNASHESEHQQRLPKPPQEHGGQGRDRRVRADEENQFLQQQIRNHLEGH